MFENTVKIQLSWTVVWMLFTATCSRMNSPMNQTNRLFFMVSFLILLRSLRVHIQKQIFTSGSVNIVE